MEPRPPMAALRAGAARPLVRTEPQSRRAAGRRSAPYLNRELSWLDFNARVLHEARDERNPLLERVEVPGHLRQHARRVLPGPRRRPPPAGRGRLDQDVAGRAHRRPSSWPRSGPGSRSSSATMRRSSPALRAGARRGGRLDPRLQPRCRTITQRLRERFVDEIFPVLTPARGRSGPPVPVHQHAEPLDRHRDARSGDRRAAVRPGQGAPDPAPPHRDRSRHTYVLLDQVIEANLDLLFSGMEILETHLFRVTRNADLAIEEDEADDLAPGHRGGAPPAALRRGGPPRGRAVDAGRDAPHPPPRHRPVRGRLLRSQRDARPHRHLWSIAELDRDDLRGAGLDAGRADPAHAAWTTTSRPTCSARSGPATSSSTTRTRASPRSVERFIAQAADDPEVLTIKHDPLPDERRLADRPRPHPGRRAGQAGRRPRRDQGPLRRGGEHHLGAQARAGGRPRRVRARRPQDPLEDRPRRPPRGFRACAATSTSGPATTTRKTARLYVDLGLLSCRPELGADVTDLFNVLTGLSRQRVVPAAARRAALAPLADPRAHRSGDRATPRPGRPARIDFKLNAIVDPACVNALYRASQARRRGEPHRPRHLLGLAGPARASRSGSRSARSSASSSSTRGSTASSTAASRSGTSDRPT